MIFTLSAAMNDLMLGVLMRQLDGAELRIYGDARPTSPNAPPGTDPLATVAYSGAEMLSGQVRASLDQDLAVGSGDATWARACTKDGTAIFDCDVGEKDSGAAIELNTTGLRKGGPVMIRSFALGIGR